MISPFPQARGRRIVTAPGLIPDSDCTLAGYFDQHLTPARQHLAPVPISA
jgi:hypothetical protein